MFVSPARVLERLNRVLPRGAWERIERRRAHALAAHPIDPELGWMWYEDLHAATLEETHDLATRAMTLGDLNGAHLLACTQILAQWRLTRGLYDFDETLREELADSDVARIPVDVLRRLPEYAPYITLRGVQYNGFQVHGCWAYFAHARTSHPQLNVALHVGSDDVIGLVLDLPSGDLDECLEATVRNTEAGMREAAGRGFAHLDMEEVRRNAEVDRVFWRALLPLLLYLCSEEPDLQGVVKAPQASNKRRYAHTFVVPQADNLLQVGFRHGGKIRMWRQEFRARATESSGLGMPKAPHIRKAHFHLYWVGAGRTVPRVKWVAATPVNVRNVDDMPVHVRPVVPDPADAR